MTVRYRYAMRRPGTREQVNQACLEVIRQSGFTIRESDLAAGRTSARATVSFRCRGENIHVYVDTDDRVELTSKSRFLSPWSTGARTAGTASGSSPA
jgi:hypothetical protein